jgi:hypothetical protein
LSVRCNEIDENKGMPPAKKEATLQEILNLPALALLARHEGDSAIAQYEREFKTTISIANKLRISKHCKLLFQPFLIVIDIIHPFALFWMII